MYFKGIVFAIALALFSLGSCAAQDKGTAIVLVKENKVLSADEFRSAISSIDSPQLIDVRTPKEFAQGHIAGALNFNVNNKDFIEQIAKLDKEQPVYLYCRSGARSARSAKMLETEGFYQVYDLAGGFMNYTE